MKYPKITIITSVYSSSNDFLIKQDKVIKSQDYPAKIEHIFVNDNIKNPKKIKGLNIINNKNNLGLSATLNKGFKMAKTNIVISLMDDCLPSTKDWLKKVVEPILLDETVAATTSDIQMPLSFWKKFDFFARAMTEKELGPTIPGVDEKACAYNINILKKIGYLDDKNFRNGGEDTDFTIKVEQSKKWKIVHTRAKVYHLHFTDTRSRIKKEKQYALLAGLISRKHYFKSTWNFMLSTFLKVFALVWFLLSLFLPIGLIYSSLLIILIANIRLPNQIKILWPDKITFLLPFFNIFLYFVYVIYYLFALVFNPKV